jgi:hypothetical protein
MKKHAKAPKDRTIAMYSNVSVTIQNVLNVRKIALNVIEIASTQFHGSLKYSNPSAIKLEISDKLKQIHRIIANVVEV